MRVDVGDLMDQSGSVLASVYLAKLLKANSAHQGTTT